MPTYGLKTCHFLYSFKKLHSNLRWKYIICCRQKTIWKSISVCVFNCCAKNSRKKYSLYITLNICTQSMQPLRAMWMCDWQFLFELRVFCVRIALIDSFWVDLELSYWCFKYMHSIPSKATQCSLILIIVLCNETYSYLVIIRQKNTCSIHCSSLNN